jgi:hypothetical protein
MPWKHTALIGDEGKAVVVTPSAALLSEFPTRTEALFCAVCHRLWADGAVSPFWLLTPGPGIRHPATPALGEARMKHGKPKRTAHTKSTAPNPNAQLRLEANLVSLFFDITG